jgi:hypothetical protein
LTEHNAANLAAQPATGDVVDRTIIFKDTNAKQSGGLSRRGGQRELPDTGALHDSAHLGRTPIGDASSGRQGDLGSNEKVASWLGMSRSSLSPAETAALLNKGARSDSEAGSDLEWDFGASVHDESDDGSQTDDAVPTAEGAQWLVGQSQYQSNAGAGSDAVERRAVLPPGAQARPASPEPAGTPAQSAPKDGGQRQDWLTEHNAANLAAQPATGDVVDRTIIFKDTNARQSGGLLRRGGQRELPDTGALHDSVDSSSNNSSDEQVSTDWLTGTQFNSPSAATATARSGPQSDVKKTAPDLADPFADLADEVVDDRPAAPVKKASQSNFEYSMHLLRVHRDYGKGYQDFMRVPHYGSGNSGALQVSVRRVDIKDKPQSETSIPGGIPVGSKVEILSLQNVGDTALPEGLHHAQNLLVLNVAHSRNMKDFSQLHGANKDLTVYASEDQRTAIEITTGAPGYVGPRVQYEPAKEAVLRRAAAGLFGTMTGGVKLQQMQKQTRNNL